MADTRRPNVDYATRGTEWGPTFLTLNAEPLEAYRKARTEGKVIQSQREYFPQLFEG